MPPDVPETLPPTPTSLPTLAGQGPEEGRRLSGWVAKYNVPSHPIRNPTVHHKPFVEVIMPGAFDRHLATRPSIPALVNHDKTQLLARTTAGTLQLRSNPTGLYFELTLPRNTVGENAREWIRRGDIEGCSLGFFTQEDEIVPRPGPTDLRIIHRAILHEVTPVCTFPAYSQAGELALRDRDPSITAAPSRPRYELRRRRLDLSR